MNILDTITAYKRQEVAAKKRFIPMEVYQSFPAFHRKTLSLSNALRNASTGIIAEHKRKSPSKSIINDRTSLPEVVQGYETAGAAGASILTDTKFFGGSLDDLLLARHHVSMPLLRKEFIIDPYQIWEAKAYGADAILLIAACLTTSEIATLSTEANALGLEVLLEVHDATELQKSLYPNIDMIGVNNRNLKTFEVSLQTSMELADQIPDTYVKVAESGLHSPEEIRLLKEYGYQGFLMGERFMKTENPGDSLMTFLQHL